MIVLASTLILAYEYLAKTTDRPTITNLSHRVPYSLVIWGWLLWLVVHLLTERDE